MSLINSLKIKQFFWGEQGAATESKHALRVSKIKKKKKNSADAEEEENKVH